MTTPEDEAPIRHGSAAKTAIDAVQAQINAN